MTRVPNNRTSLTKTQHQTSLTGGHNVGGIDATLCDKDIMIDVQGFYSNHLEDSHLELPAGSANQ